MPREFTAEDYDDHYFGHAKNGPISNYRRPYNSEGLKKSARFWMWSAHAALELRAKLGMEKINVMDLGGATGMFASYLDRLPQTTVYNFDLSTWATQNSVPAMRGKTVQSEAGLIAAQTGSFDGLVSFDVLEHVPNRNVLAVASEMFRVLRPGGRGVVVINTGEFGDFENDKSHVTKCDSRWWGERFQDVGFDLSRPLSAPVRPLFRTVPRIAQKVTALHPGLIIIDKP